MHIVQRFQDLYETEMRSLEKLAVEMRTDSDPRTPLVLHKDPSAYRAELQRKVDGIRRDAAASRRQLAELSRATGGGPPGGGGGGGPPGGPPGQQVSRIAQALGLTANVSQDQLVQLRDKWTGKFGNCFYFGLTGSCNKGTGCGSAHVAPAPTEKEEWVAEVKTALGL